VILRLKIKEILKFTFLVCPVKVKRFIFHIRGRSRRGRYRSSVKQVKGFHLIIYFFNNLKQ